MKKEFSWDDFQRVPVVGIARNISFENIIHILPIYQSSGLNTIEITMNSFEAQNIIQYAREKYPDSVNVGAGTVCTLQDLDKALAAGAQFIVTPIMNEQIIEVCLKKQVPIFPGAFTPTEIFKAWSAGAKMIKVFPTTELGPQYIKDIKAPLNQIRLMPTGGVNIDNCVNYLKAGADALGVGSQLFDKTLIRNKNWKALSEHFNLFVKTINTCKSAIT